MWPYFYFSKLNHFQKETLKILKLSSIKIYANSHYVTPRPTLNEAIKTNLSTYLERYRMLTDAINIKDAFIINLQLLI